MVKYVLSLSSGPQGRIEIRSRSPGGRLLGMIKFLPEGIQESALEVRWTEETVELTEASGTADLYFVYYDEGKKATRFRPFYLDWIVFGF